MPNIKSAKKRVVVAELNRQKNASQKSAIKTQLKKFDAAVAAGDKEAASAELVKAVSAVDKGAKKGLLHKNAAARRKSALYGAFNQM
ncbi:MAG: 30S ribosomal protein S20 [Firmicutes bacterium]|nr:30S ribosomal protein S20 [Bacillota bacterium]